MPNATPTTTVMLHAPGSTSDLIESNWANDAGSDRQGGAGAK